MGRPADAGLGPALKKDPAQEIQVWSGLQSGCFRYLRLADGFKMLSVFMGTYLQICS